MLQVPDAQVGEVEKVLASHEAWMWETHRGPSEPNPLIYAITKASEFNNPLDPSEGTSGFSPIALTEIYNGKDGCQAHMDISDSWKSLPRHDGEGGPSSSRYDDVWRSHRIDRGLVAVAFK